MQKFNKIALGAVNGLLLLAPTMASAALGAGQNWDRGFTNAESSGLSNSSIYNVIQVTLGWLLGVLGFIAIIGFIISGILYLTAAGNETQIEKAKTAMTYSIVGVIVALTGFVVVTAVGNWLAGNYEF